MSFPIFRYALCILKRSKIRKILARFLKLRWQIKKYRRTAILTVSLKVSKSRKLNTKFSNTPKNQRNFVQFFALVSKGQLISKANCQSEDSSKKRTNELIFTTMWRVFVRFLEEIEDSKKAFQNYLTFRYNKENYYLT